MSNVTLQGCTLGLVVAIAAWGDEPPGRVSPFPDGLALVVLAVLAAIALQDVDRASRARVATMLGISAGAVVGIATVLRGALRWTAPSITMLAITFASSLLAVFAVTHLVSFASRRRAS